MSKRKRRDEAMQGKQLLALERHEESEEEESEEDETALEIAALQEAAGEPAVAGVNNEDALTQRTEDIKIDLPWVETLDTCKFKLEDVEDVHDDLKREVAFYNVAVSSVVAAKRQLEASKVPYKRPTDYFAEMLKSDSHMAHIKDRLIFEQRKMETFEKRKEQTSYKKRAKQIQDERLKVKRDRKLENMSKVEDWKKGKKDREAAMAVRSDADFDDFVNNKPRRAEKSNKRKGLDAKYGRGGKIQKRNNQDSYLDMDKSYSGKRNKTPFAGMVKKGGKKNFYKARAQKGNQRPGKSKRDKARTR